MGETMAVLNVIFQFMTATAALYLVFALLAKHRDERRSEEETTRIVAQQREAGPPM